MPFLSVMCLNKPLLDLFHILLAGRKKITLVFLLFLHIVKLFGLLLTVTTLFRLCFYITWYTMSLMYILHSCLFLRSQEGKITERFSIIQFAIFFPLVYHYYYAPSKVCSNRGGAKSSKKVFSPFPFRIPNLNFGKCKKIKQRCTWTLLKSSQELVCFNYRLFI